MKQTRLKPISKKRVEEMRQERAIMPLLCERAGGYWNGNVCVGGRCEKCHNLPDFRGLTKHEIKFRSQGGDPTDPDNCLLLCGRCHSKEHGIREVPSG